MDAITRAFWWGHDLGVRKMHLLNLDNICTPKKDGGIGLKKFSIMNQVMLAKQYWRISHNPQSFISRTFKARYFPRSSIHDWSGHDIPLDHPPWYPLQTDNPNFRFGTVVDLIDCTSHTWKPGLVRTVYLPQCAYNLLHRDSTSFNENRSRQHNVHLASWKLVWKMGVPLKKKAKRCGFAYEAINMQETALFHGASTCTYDSTFNAIQEAKVIAAMKARNLGFTHVLFLSDNKRST
uniref:RNase H type-1 domain-containing protein n=1 Tax=Quercus lobata TaxID=97700 RepID=A0A7N2KXH0_QUELO